MTLTAPPTNGTTTSGRTLLTELPGPRSRELHAARERAVPRGFGVVQPVFVDHAEGALLVDVDGNRLIDMASGIAVTSVGAAGGFMQGGGFGSWSKKFGIAAAS